MYSIINIYIHYLVVNLLIEIKIPAVFLAINYNLENCE